MRARIDNVPSFPRRRESSVLATNDTGSPPSRGRRTRCRRCSLLDEPRVDEPVQVGHLLDDADLEPQRGGFLVELLKLAAEELLVRGAILPAQIFLRRLELLARLLDAGAHDLEALLRFLRDQLDRLEIAVGERLRGLRVVGEEF